MKGVKLMDFWSTEWTFALIGGVLIGLAVTFMLLLKGRVTGISGILYGVLKFTKNDWYWRAHFIAGLIVGGIVLNYAYPESLQNTLDYGPLRVGFAGVLVGYGTLLGNGCTSGHGVCGISRMSLRSITATMTFMAFGILTVALFGLLG
jgi:uncharacterized membrane protein YedE/YeeE